MALSTHFDPVAALSPQQRAAMQELLAQHFHGVDAQVFTADLANKSHVLRICDGTRLVGLSTMHYSRRCLHGEDAGLVYSGDTIMDPSAWGEGNLGAAWAAAVQDLHQQQGGGSLWWLLLSSGLRTYRYLSVYAQCYAPAPPGRADPQAAALLPLLARERFGAAFDAQRSVVRLAHPQTLRSHFSIAPAHLAKDPAAAVFLTRNTEAAQGDELVSLCRFNEDNLTRAGRLALRQGRRVAAELVQ